MTSTAVLAGQSVGTGSNRGEGLFAATVAFESTTTAFVLEARLVNGVSPFTNRETIRVWYASTYHTPFNPTDAVGELRNDARYLDIVPRPEASLGAIRHTLLEPALGSNLFFWCDVPTFPVASTLYINLTELP